MSLGDGRRIVRDRHHGHPFRRLRRSGLAFRLGRRRFSIRHPVEIRRPQYPASLLEIDPLILPDKRNRIATRATAETLINLLGLINLETRRPLIVERTTSDPFAPLFFQRNPRLDHLDNIDPLKDGLRIN